MKERLASAARPARTVFRKEVELAVNDAVGATQASVASELSDIKRILADDMDAANEATAVFGRLLAKLGDRLAEVEERLASIDERLEALAATPPGALPGAPPGAAPDRKRPAKPAASGAAGAAQKSGESEEPAASAKE